MKVLQVHGGMNIGGTETVIMNWYSNIDREKIQFDFTTTFKKECPYDSVINNLGGEIKYIIPVSEGGYLKHCISLYKVMKAGKYDVIHSHMNFHGGIVAFIGKLCGVKKRVCHAHSAPDNLSVGVKNKILSKLINLFATDKLACNEGAGNYVFGVGSNFKVLKNAIKINQINEKNSNLLKEYNLGDSKVIATIGRIDENKNQSFLIEIAKKIKNENIKILIIGDGDLRNKIQADIKAASLENNVILVGNQSNIDQWFSIIDLVMMPSFYEGVPMTIIEAQSKGIPSILSNRIKKDVDLGLGLIKFESLESLDKWIEYSKNIPLRNNDFDHITNILTEKGYNIKTVVKDLVTIYEDR